MSFVYRMPPGVEVGQLGLVVALAVADAVASVTHLDPRIKWPNDILLDGYKTAGILVEVAHSAPNNGGAGLGTARPEDAASSAPVGVSSPAPQNWGGGAVLGIGINVSHERFDGAEEFVYPPTSLRLASGQAPAVEAVITSVGRALSKWEDCWRRKGFLPIVEECRARLAVGAVVRQGESHAELLGLTSTGAAQVRLLDGTFVDWTTVD